MGLIILVSMVTNHSYQPHPIPIKPPPPGRASCEEHSGVMFMVGGWVQRPQFGFEDFWGKLPKKVKKRKECDFALPSLSTHFPTSTHPRFSILLKKKEKRKKKMHTQRPGAIFFLFLFRSFRPFARISGNSRVVGDRNLVLQCLGGEKCELREGEENKDRW